TPSARSCKRSRCSLTARRRLVLSISSWTTRLVVLSASLVLPLRVFSSAISVWSWASSFSSLARPLARAVDAVLRLDGGRVLVGELRQHVVELALRGAQLAGGVGDRGLGGDALGGRRQRHGDRRRVGVGVEPGLDAPELALLDREHGAAGRRFVDPADQRALVRRRVGIGDELGVLG